ncbi:MAG: VanZ family protein [Eubacteriales bacterium]|nr:VanZ family protein [Eubacteriales bacterium]
MQKEKNNRLCLFVCWSLTIICMGVIFWLSSRTATESSEQSGVIVEFLRKIFGDNVFTDFIVRKSAHCLEFTGLSFLFNLSLYVTKNKPSFVFAVMLTSIYAATDEFHQLFVEGRSCQITDWAIDTAGAILGALGFLVILSIIKKPNKTSKSK